VHIAIVKRTFTRRSSDDRLVNVYMATEKDRTRTVNDRSFTNVHGRTFMNVHVRERSRMNDRRTFTRERSWMNVRRTITYDLFP